MTSVGRGMQQSGVHRLRSEVAIVIQRLHEEPAVNFVPLLN